MAKRKEKKIAIDSKAGEMALMWRDTCRKMKWWDWSLIKMASMLFGIMLAALFPEILGWFDWYWWFAIFIIIEAMPIYKTYGPTKKPKKYKNDEKVAWIGGTPGGLSGLPKAICGRITWWDTGLIKLGIMFFGIGLVALCPTITSYFDWYWWGIATLVLSLPTLQKAYS